MCSSDLFVLGYKTLWTSIGIIAGWALIFLGLSFYMRDRISRSRWKAIHRFTLLAWVAGIAHTLGEGTDAGQTWFLVLIGLTAAPALAALTMRVRGRIPETASQAPLS